eukprot:UN15139
MLLFFFFFAFFLMPSLPVFSLAFSAAIIHSLAPGTTTRAPLEVLRSETLVSAPLITQVPLTPPLVPWDEPLRNWLLASRSFVFQNIKKTLLGINTSIKMEGTN